VNGVEADEGQVYDKASTSRQPGVYELLVSYRSEDMWAPLRQAEALATDQVFVDCIDGYNPLTAPRSAGGQTAETADARCKNVGRRSIMTTPPSLPPAETRANVKLFNLKSTCTVVRSATF
jgi:hypothetical protein